MRPAPWRASKWCVWWGYGQCPAPDPTCEDLGVDALMCAAVQAVDDAEVAEHLVRALQRPQLHGQIFNDHPDMELEVVVGHVVVVVPRLDPEHATVDSDRALAHRQVVVRGEVEADEEILQVVVGDA